MHLPPWADWMRRQFRIAAVIFTVSILLEGTLEMTSPDGQKKLIASNAAFSRALGRMQPFAVASVFYQHFMEEHKWYWFQWDAPFNADEARRRLVRQQCPRVGYDCVSHITADLIPGRADFQAGDMPCYFRDTTGQGRIPAGITPFIRQPARVVVPGDTSELNQEQIGFTSANDRINAMSGPLDWGKDRFGFLASLVIALPDAYLTSARALIPHAPLWIQIALALLAVYGLFIGLVQLPDKWLDEAGCWIFLAALALLPVAVSSLAGLLWLIAHGATSLLGKALAAPAFSVTASVVGTPLVHWLSKLAEHHLVEGGLRFLPRLLQRILPRFAWLAEE